MEHLNKAIILLDVDFVLNPGNSRLSDYKFEPMFRSSDASGGYNLNLSREMGDDLAALDCDIRWLTTWIRWGDFANTDIGPALGWGFKPPILIESEHVNKSTWKLDTVRDFLSVSGPKVIWIDDDIDDFLRFSSGEIDPHNRLLCICPDKHQGFMKHHIDCIKTFLKI